jgi:membrane-associated protein
MELVMEFVNMILHIDQHLAQWMQLYGAGIYLVVFLIVFAETGLVVTPFLPGDSLLFALGALTAIDGGLQYWVLVALLFVATLLGDNTNFFIGRTLGPKVFNNKNSKIFNPKHLTSTHQFFAKHGPKAVIMARFVPIFRTFAPFVAGIGKMAYSKFISFSFIGSFLWIFIFLSAGHFFGNMPVVKKNFTLVIFAVIGVSVLPILFEMYKTKFSKHSS